MTSVKMAASRLASLLCDKSDRQTQRELREAYRESSVCAYATTSGEGIASSCYARCRASVAVTQSKCPELTVT